CCLRVQYVTFNTLSHYTLRAFEAEVKFKNRELVHRQSQTSRLQIERSLMTSLEIANGDANLKCFSQFRGMRVRRERLVIFINTEEGEEVGAHLIVLSVSFHVFEKHSGEKDVVDIGVPRCSLDVVNAAVEYAYVGIKNISPEVVLRLYLLAHNLRNKALVDGCTRILCARIEETKVSEVWSAANATRNEEVCAPLGAMN
ncbi:unnamed protein product, partial [Hymenolepis diminuta]